jgi:tRNA_anti-like
MRKTGMIYIFIVSAALFVAGIASIYGYQEYTRKLPDMHSLPSAFSIKSRELISQFQTDESKATAQYAGKVISVQGFVGDRQLTDSSGTVYLNNGISMVSVICQFDQKNLPEMRKLERGDQVTIKGLCTGYLMDVVMVRCIAEP